jgi:hypothetical protein
MPAIRGKPKKQIGYKVSAELIAKMDLDIQNEFATTYAEIINRALSLYYDRREYDKDLERKVVEVISHQKVPSVAESVQHYKVSKLESKEMINEYFNSEIGKEHIKRILFELLQEGFK